MANKSYTLTRKQPFSGTDAGLDHTKFELNQRTPGMFIGRQLGFNIQKEVYQALAMDGVWENDFWKMTEVTA